MVSPAYVVLKPKATANSAYLAQVLRAPRLRYLLRAYSYGLTDDRLRLYFDDFASIPVAMPSLKEQRRLAELLEVWDEAIGATEQLLTNRGALKTALAEKLLLQPMAESRECGQVLPRDPSGSARRSVRLRASRRVERRTELSPAIGEGRFHG